MFVFTFFTAVFTSVSWLIYGFLFVRSHLTDSTLFEQTPQDVLVLLAVVFLPIFVIWGIFGYVNQFLNNRSMNSKQSELLRQLQKNQDYTDLVVRVMLDAEHEIKDGFVLNKFDVFINDMNEALGEIIQRCNIASSAQLEQLWQRVRRGEKWALGKAILEAAKSQNTFDAWAREKVGRDKVFRGSLLEFCSRYQNLLQLLEKHDRDRIFLRMIETGVFGKVYSIIAPLSEGLGEIRADVRTRIASESETNYDYASVLHVASLEEPSIDETIANVDKDENEEENDVYDKFKPSLLSRFNPFHRKQDDSNEETEEDPFFQALQNSFDNKRDVVKEPSFSQHSLNDEKEEPSLKIEDNEKSFTVGTTFNNVDSTLASLRENVAEEPHISLVGNESNEFTSKKVEATQEDDEDLVYPFGGWTDENKYNP
ncbi:MAG: hypothetical protein MJ212_00520 [Alphaproteobacteria bacterium]|nr:hypothetical protein [Alphaproteobacteria bacterium]